MYVIGQTYQQINEKTNGKPTEKALIHSIFLLSYIKSDKGLNAILEIMKQNVEFSEYHLEEWYNHLLPPALYNCAADNLPPIISYINQPGFNPYLRSCAIRTLNTIALLQPQRRNEIIEEYRKILTSMVDRLPKKEACDNSFATLFIRYLIDLRAKELIPEIKAVFATGCVYEIFGDCEKVIADVQKKVDPEIIDEYVLKDIYSEYKTFDEETKGN